MKRLFWATTGYAAGIGTSIYVQRRVRRTVDRYAPEYMRQDVAARGRNAAERARGLVIDLRDAASEGIDAMRQHEDQLRDEFTPGVSAHRHRPARIHP